MSASGGGKAFPIGGAVDGMRAIYWPIQSDKKRLLKSGLR